MNQQFFKDIDYHQQRVDEDGCCDMNCVHHVIINNGSPNAYTYCQKFKMPVQWDWRCKYYISIFDEDPNLLKSFASQPNNSKNTTVVKKDTKKGGFFSKFFK